MKKLIGLLLAIVMLGALVTSAIAESQGTVMYVYTQNGKGLNVRSSMSTANNSNIIGSLPYRAKVFTYGNPQPGWTYVESGTLSGYVMSRFLVKKDPGAYNPSPDPTPEPNKDFDTRSATTVEQINTLLASAKSVTPYTVTVRPTRASGWVYMRWIPSRNSKEVATYAANSQLTVIAELKDWYQVRDESNGRVGYIYKSYIQ